MTAFRVGLVLLLGWLAGICSIVSLVWFGGEYEKRKLWK